MTCACGRCRWQADAPRPHWTRFCSCGCGTVLWRHYGKTFCDFCGDVLQRNGSVERAEVVLDKRKQVV